VLTVFIQDGFLPSDLFHRSPIVVYLRQQFFVEQLETTLHSLGLGPSGVRLQLRFDRSLNASESPQSLTGRGPTEPEPVGLVSPPTEDAQPNHRFTSSLETPAPLPEESLDHRLTEPFPTPVLPSVEEVRALCHRMINSNFDCVSSPAVLTITKYLDNLIRHPSDHKYRTINLLNTAFVENVAAAKGALDLLQAMGFRPQVPPYLRQTPLSVAAQQAPSVSSKIFFQFEKISEEEAEGQATASSATLIPMARLTELREKVFNELMDELNIPLEKRPVPATPPSQRQQAAPVPAAIPFDPYKPFIFRMANQVPASHLDLASPHRASLPPSLDSVAKSGQGRCSVE
jgi:hypothetical protein